MKKLTIGAGLLGGAALLKSGRGKALLDGVTGLVRRGARRKDFNDATLARKVETEIFRDADAPKGNVDVNVQNGVVQLRGEVERPELMDELVEKARNVQGVEDVENLLHVPGTPAPMHQ